EAISIGRPVFQAKPESILIYPIPERQPPVGNNRKSTNRIPNSATKPFWSSSVYPIHHTITD
ncbi:MAG: hypothetical protein ACI814_000956, partial [Mariniblastus sp.]